MTGLQDWENHLKPKLLLLKTLSINNLNSLQTNKHKTCCHSLTHCMLPNSINNSINSLRCSTIPNNPSYNSLIKCLKPKASNRCSSSSTRCRCNRCNSRCNKCKVSLRTATLKCRCGRSRWPCRCNRCNRWCSRCNQQRTNKCNHRFSQSSLLCQRRKIN